MLYSYYKHKHYAVHCYVHRWKYAHTDYARILLQIIHILFLGHYNTNTRDRFFLNARGLAAGSVEALVLDSGGTSNIAFVLRKRDSIFIHQIGNLSTVI